MSRRKVYSEKWLPVYKTYLKVIIVSDLHDCNGLCICCFCWLDESQPHWDGEIIAVKPVTRNVCIT